MALIQTVTLLPIESVAIKVTPQGKHFVARLTARRESWFAHGDTTPEAITAVMAELAAEPRPRDRGRPPTRYRVARSVLQGRPT